MVCLVSVAEPNAGREGKRERKREGGREGGRTFLCDVSNLSVDRDLA